MKGLYKAIFASFTFFILFSTSAASTIDMRHINYNDQGKGQPLVLIHAFPTAQGLWDPQINELKKHFRVITLDLWGFGKSKATNGQAVTMEEYADEVKQLLDHLKVKHAIIGGESMGGYVVMAFYAKYSAITDGLILSDTQVIADSPEIMKKRESAAIDVMQNGSRKLLDNFLPKALSHNAPSIIKTQLRHMTEEQKPSAIASALRGMAVRHDTTSFLKDSTLPILIITGGMDSLISPEQSKSMHTIAKNSKLVVIDSAGHLSSLENPEKWNQAVKDMYL